MNAPPPDVSILALHECPARLEEAALWFHATWGVPLEAYRESMLESLRPNASIPRWYVALADGHIVAGLGIIENDFHDRKDLRPNVCAIYTEPAWRRHGLCRSLLQRACSDMKALGLPALYLLTDHSDLYEHLGWTFLCMAHNEGEDSSSRIYLRKL